MSKNVRISKALAMFLAIILLFGMIPCKMDTATAENFEMEEDGGSVYTSPDDSESDIIVQKTQDASGQVNSMAFSTKSLDGKNVVINAQTNEILVQNHRSANQASVDQAGADQASANQASANQANTNQANADQASANQANADATDPSRDQTYDEHMRFADSISLLLEEYDTQKYFTTIKITADDPTMIKNGEVVDVVENEQVAPIIENDVFMVPLDMLVDNAGEQTDYSSEEETIIITTEEEEIEISLVDGSVSGRDLKRQMQRKPSVHGDRVFVPLEDIAGALGYTVEQTGDTAILSRPYQTKRLIVKACSEIDTYGAVAVVRSTDNLYVLQYKTEAEAKEALEKYSTGDDIVFAQTDNIVRTTGNTPLSWGVTRMKASIYQEFLSTSIEKMPEIVVGVLDTGIDPDHPHFNGRIIPNDYDYTSTYNSSYDGYFHGTHVSGIIVDATLPNVKVQPYKVLDNNGSGSDITIYLGIIAAADNNVDVINMSLGGYGTSELVYNAVMYAIDLNIAVVVAAGNDNSDVTKYFPAQIEEVITVAAVDKYDQRAYFSNWGDSIDLAAAGVDVLSSIPGGGYKAYDGTSMAAPHVAAAAAMLKTFNRTLAPLHIEAILRNSADNAGIPGWDEYYGDGILNLNKVEVLDVTAPPVFSANQGWYRNNFDLVLTSETKDAKIYYTLDGSAPTESSRLYTGPIFINSSGRVRARAYSNGRLSSGIISRLYHVSQYPASMHYTAMEYSDFSWEYEDNNTNTQALKITFDALTDFASNDWDIHFLDLGIFLLDGNGKLLLSALTGRGRYSANELAGKSLYIQGNSFSVMFKGNVTSDTFGFSISNIEPITVPMTLRPVFDIMEGVYYESQKTITLTAPSPNTTIYYTTDGSIPTQYSSMYTGGIKISQPTVIKAIAIGQGMAPSYVESKIFYVSRYPESLHYSHTKRFEMEFPIWEYPGNPDFLKVTFSNDCNFGSDGIDAAFRWITQTIGENGCGLIEITDGNNENIYNDYDDSQYFKDKQLAGRTVIIPGNKLKIWHFAWVTKNTYGFKIDSIEPIYGARTQAPVFSVAPGYYKAPQTVSMTSSAGAFIYYTTDGTMPTKNSKLYIAPISVPENQTIRAVAVRDGWLDSEIIKADYYISKYPESLHDQRFSNSFAESNVWTYEYPDSTVEALDLRFNIKTDFFYMTVYDGNGKEVFYSVLSSGYAGKTIRVPGNKFSIKVDFSYIILWDMKDELASFYGFKIDNINPVGGAICPSLPGGVYDSPIIVKLDSAYPYIYYTTDGKMPDTTSKLYSGQIAISGNTMLKAIGYNGSTYSYMFETAYYVTKPPESLHYTEGWYDATWEYVFNGMSLIEIVFDEDSRCDDVLIYTNRDNLVFDNLPIDIRKDQGGQISLKLYTNFLNIQYLGGFSNSSDFGFKIIKLGEAVNDITDAFTDPAFKAAVQNALGDSGGRIFEHKLAHLAWLNISGKNVKSLAGIEYMANLRTLNCSNNQLTSLQRLPLSVTWLDCTNNQLTSLDLSNFIALEILYCRSNFLTFIDVTKNRNLLELDCRLNFLPGRAAIAGLNESKTKLRFEPQYQPGYEKTIIFPDVNFKRALINQGVDRNGDNEITRAEAVIVEYLSVSGYEIADLTGIENFAFLLQFECHHNQLKSLPWLPPTLEYLNCSDNQLESINLSDSTALKYLNCRSNLLTSLDITKNAKLVELNCQLNHLPSKSAISGLDEYRTKLLFDPQYQPGDDAVIVFPDANFKKALLGAGVDRNTDKEISKFEAKAVNTLLISNCSISNLTGIENFALLQYLYCSNNQLKTLSALPLNLEYINCSYNQLESIDFSNNTNLERLECRDNRLTSLDVTKNIRLVNLDCRQNYMPSKAAIAGLNENRTTLLFDPQYRQGDEEAIVFPDPIFKMALIGQKVDKNGDNEISKAEALSVESLWLGNYGITDLTGIEYFVSLREIFCFNNQLTSISKLPPLIYFINCSNNQLTSIDLSNCMELEHLLCHDNLLTSLDVTKNGKLMELECRWNNMPGKTAIKGLNESMTMLRFDPQNFQIISGQVRSFNPQRKTMIDLYVTGTNTLVASTTIPALPSGIGQVLQSFTLKSVPEGVYDLVVRKQTHLNCMIKGITVGADEVDLTKNPDNKISTITMPCGDINGDGYIDSSDLSIIILRENYDKHVFEPGVNPLADLTGSGWVNSSSLSVLILRENYNRGPVVYTLQT